MIAFGHTAVGVIVGVTAYKFLGDGNLASGLVITGAVGVLSHYLADSIPHGHFFKHKNYRRNIIPVIIFDLLFSIIIFLGATYLKSGFNENFFYIMFGIGGSQLPDVIDGLIYINFLKNKGLLKLENNFHKILHWHAKNSEVLLLGWLDIWQLMVILSALFLII